MEAEGQLCTRDRQAANWLRAFVPEVQWQSLFVSVRGKSPLHTPREDCLMLQPKRLPLPDVGRGDLLVDIIARFPEVEDPLDNWWTLRYETSSWYCWRDLQTASLPEQEHAIPRKWRSQGGYFVVRAWEQ